mmetsp:Transcript_10735/g.29489  ORF Transcript_10735/g.29489 Transcript_10735/m.29489 type:complete len:220 (-) Transcript_10735:326-985(-)
MRLEPCFKLLFLTYTFKAGSASSALSPPATNAVAAPGVAAGVLTRAPDKMPSPHELDRTLYGRCIVIEPLHDRPLCALTIASPAILCPSNADRKEHALLLVSAACCTSFAAAGCLNCSTWRSACAAAGSEPPACCRTSTPSLVVIARAKGMVSSRPARDSQHRAGWEGWLAGAGTWKCSGECSVCTGTLRVYRNALSGQKWSVCTGTLRLFGSAPSVQK